MSAEKKGARVLVQQVRSANRANRRWLLTLRALGLGRIGKSCEHELTAPTKGMIESVKHLVEVSPVK